VKLHGLGTFPHNYDLDIIRTFNLSPTLINITICNNLPSLQWERERDQCAWEREAEPTHQWGTVAMVLVANHLPRVITPQCSSSRTYLADLEKKDMLKIFQRWARVKEVFISRRLNKWGRRFGFVRLFDVKNVGKLKKELDQIYIGNRKLFVNILKYRRHQVEPPRAGIKDTRNVETVRPMLGKNKLEKDLDHIYIGNRKLFVNIPKYHRHQVEPPRAGIKDVMKVDTVRPMLRKKKLEGADENMTKKGKVVWVERRGKKSFVDAVRGHARWEWKGSVFKTQKTISVVDGEKRSWLVQCRFGL